MLVLALLLLVACKSICAPTLFYLLLLIKLFLYLGDMCPSLVICCMFSTNSSYFCVSLSCDSGLKMPIFVDKLDVFSSYFLYYDLFCHVHFHLDHLDSFALPDLALYVSVQSLIGCLHSILVLCTPFCHTTSVFVS